ncbi:hypothetical protein JT321_gp63 [Providencia phage Kokobel1]|uniref:Uncharacterized protein n=1 Tax=Providencia phage Kokobel1 TaxID=2783540 RepID=A0A873WG58_9CAUD|nr:hypothetical protein JT321_gp63 [Providencia phage Kokobel1]QPB11490.1 hypothetical protein [Providencia phage Kokobel1]
MNSAITIPFDMFKKAYKLNVSALAGSYYFYAVVSEKAAPNCLEKFIDDILNKATIPIAISEERIDARGLIERDSFIRAEIVQDLIYKKIGDMYISLPICPVKEPTISIHP